MYLSSNYYLFLSYYFISILLFEEIMETSFKIGTILDIPIRIHFTFLFILALFTWVLSIEHVTLFGFTIGFGDLSLQTIYKIGLGAVSSILLFVCVLLHELGHSYTLQKFGHKVNSITLFIFGGSSESEEIPKEPKKEMKIAVMGPVISLIIGISMYLVYFLLRPYQGLMTVNILLALFSTLSFYNIVLAVFNLIPAFPIDGGRILRSLLAMRMQYQKATKTAASIGKGIAIALGIFGIFFNIWLLLIAVFIYVGAYQEQKTLEITNALRGKQIEYMINTNFHSVSPDITAQDLYENMRVHNEILFPVVKNEKLLGIITIKDLQRIDKTRWHEITVKQLMRKDVATVKPDADAFLVFKSLMKNNLDRIFVQENDKLIGTITRNDLLNSVRFYDINQNI
jgi:Zn-dependent protease/CBS domain-containing protein